MIKKGKTKQTTQKLEKKEGKNQKRKRKQEAEVDRREEEKSQEIEKEKEQENLQFKSIMTCFLCSKCFVFQFQLD